MMPILMVAFSTVEYILRHGGILKNCIALSLILHRLVKWALRLCYRYLTVLFVDFDVGFGKLRIGIEVFAVVERFA